MRFNKFYKCSVRIFNIRKVAGCFTHIETVTLMTLFTVDSKWKSLVFTYVFQIVHPIHIITEMNKTRVAPEPAFKYLFPMIRGTTYEFDYTISKYFTESASERLRSFKEYPAAFYISSRKISKVIENACSIINNFIVA